MARVTAEEIKQVTRNVFAGMGATPHEVDRLVEHIVENNLIGYDSHGVRVVPDYVAMIEKGHIELGADSEKVAESSSHAVIDAHWGLGQLAGWKTIEIAVEKAGHIPVAAVTTGAQPFRPVRRVHREDGERRSGRLHRCKRPWGRPECGSLGRSGKASFGKSLFVGYTRSGRPDRGRYFPHGGCGG